MKCSDIIRGQVVQVLLDTTTHSVRDDRPLTILKKERKKSCDDFYLPYLLNLQRGGNEREMKEIGQGLEVGMSPQ